MDKQKYDPLQIPSPWATLRQWLNAHPVCKSLSDSLCSGFIKMRHSLKYTLNYLVKHNLGVRRGYQIVQRILHQHDGIITFLRGWAKNPIAMGAIAPSSKYLAQEMASHICQQHPGIIIELGAGTGVVTEALLQSGISPENLIVIEYSNALTNKLRQRFPDVRVIAGNAMNLRTLIADESRPINAIVSSLPLRSLPKLMTQAILEQVNASLTPGSKYIQFTYSLRKSRFNVLSHYRQVSNNRVWRNLPPARVDVWEAC